MAHSLTSAPTRWAPFGRTVAITSATGLLVVGQLYVVIPLLPALAREWGTTSEAATATATAFGLAYALGFLVTGPLSDRYGRSVVITTGLALTAVTTAAVAVAPSLAVACALRVVQGLGAAGFSPAALAYLGERVEPRRRLIAITWLVTSLFAAAPVAQVSAQLVGGWLGWRAVFGLGAAGVVVAAVATRAVLLPDLPGAATTLRASFRAMGRLVLRGRLVLVFAAALSVLGAFAGIYTAVELHPDLVGDPGAVAVLRAGGLPAMLVVVFLAGRLTVVRPTLRAALALLAGAGCTLALLGVAGTPVAAVAVITVFVAAITVVSPGLTELVGVTSAPARAAGVALYTFMLLTGASLGPVLVAVLSTHGSGVVLGAIAVVQVAGAALLLVADRLFPKS